MTIAEKITRAKADYDAVYEGGKAKAFAEVEPINTELEQILYGKDTGGRGFYDKFWDDYQQNGERVEYDYAFSGRAWSDETYSKVKYGFGKPTSCTGMYRFSRQISDTIQELDCENIRELNNVYADSRLRKIRVRVYETNRYSLAFLGTSYLEELEIYGTIGQNGFNVQWSTLLDKASITRIINALSATTSGLTVTLSKTAVNNAFTDAEWNALIAPKSNWTISLV